MPETKGPEKLGDVIKQYRSTKPPAYEWQEFALYVIQRLNIPNFKRNSVFKICKENSKSEVEAAMNDTLELCDTGAKWKYFFKIIGSKE